MKTVEIELGVPTGSMLGPVVTLCMSKAYPKLSKNGVKYIFKTYYLDNNLVARLARS